MVDESELRAMLSREVLDPEGKSVGYVETVFKDRETGKIEWLGVMTGTWRHHHRLVPATDVESSGTTVTVPWSKEQVEKAPEYEDPDSPISEELEREAYRHYGREPAIK
jgi:sporulation protein YlmC with PRC-barrel domain